MSIDRSLKTSGSLNKHRNVLTRTERIERLAGSGRFDMESGSPLSLPKVANRKVAASKKSGKKGKEEETAEGADATKTT